MSCVAEMPAICSRGAPECQSFVSAIVKELQEFLVSELDPTQDNACRFVHPQELERKLAPLAARASGASTEELMGSFKLVLAETVKMGHQRCLNTNFHRADVVAIMADWVAATINTSIYTYETAPVVTIIERQILARYGELLGWNKPGDDIGGSMPPGGSMSNLYGVCLARHTKFPHVREHGWRAADRPKLFTSVDGHYSAKKVAMLIGMGTDALVTIGTDPVTNSMDPDLLRSAVEAAKADGATPFCVIGTAGTTLTGAVDPLDKLASVCEDFGLWLHVDGCMGGSLIHSPTHRVALRGIERADSFALNPHKMLGAPLQCCVFVTRHKALLRETFGTKAAYLFNADKQYDACTYDLGDEVFQCGRRVDCLKLWALWHHRGDEGMAAYIDRAVERTDRFCDALARRRGVYLPLLSVSSHVPSTCFFWLPPPLRFDATQDVSKDAELRALLGRANKEASEASHAFEMVDSVPPIAKIDMMEEGFGLITCSRLQDFPNFWRVITNGAVDWSDAEIARFLDILDTRCMTVFERKQKAAEKANVSGDASPVAA